MGQSAMEFDHLVQDRFADVCIEKSLARQAGLGDRALPAYVIDWLISRLLPLVQPRVNLIELAPKGTGKSFVFSQLSRHAWLISGGVVTRAQLFYDMQQKSAGVITRYDAIILDEVQTIHFSNPGEIVGALKGYLESGEFRVMQFKGDSEAGLVLLANIPIGSDLRPRDSNYFSVMPDFLQETAFLDRFHGLIPGWQIPRITKESLGEGMGLKADYFSEVLHALRGRPEYLDYVKTHLYSEGDLRDIRAVERLASGYLKLLFPDLSCATSKHFEEYCLLPARQLRLEIRHQLATLDPEYKPELARVEVV